MSPTIQLLILIPLYLALFLIAFYAAITGMAPMPSSHRSRDIIVTMIKEINPQKGRIYELGAGYGTLAIAIARLFPQMEIVAVELSPVIYACLCIRKRINRLENLTLIRQNIFNVSLYDASIVICYLFPKAMRRLDAGQFQNLPKGTAIISNSFSIPTRKAEQVIESNDLFKSDIMLYKN